MKLLTLQQHLDRVPIRWNMQYKNRESKKHLKITNKINSLTKPIKKEEVDAVIGNSSWTRFECDCCNKQSDKLIYFESKLFDGYEGPHGKLCIDCINKMQILIKES